MLVFVCVCFFLFSFFLMAQNRLSVKTQTQEGVSSANKLSSLKGHLLFIACFYCTFFLLCKSVGCRFKFFFFCLRCATLRVS